MTIVPLCLQSDRLLFHDVESLERHHDHGACKGAWLQRASGRSIACSFDGSYLTQGTVFVCIFAFLFITEHFACHSNCPLFRQRLQRLQRRLITPSQWWSITCGFDGSYLTHGTVLSLCAYLYSCISSNTSCIIATIPYFGNCSACEGAWLHRVSGRLITYGSYLTQGTVLTCWCICGNRGAVVSLMS